MLTGPVQADIEDYPSLLECVNRSFGREPGPGDMAGQLPHCLGPDARRVGQYLVMKDAGRVVGALSCVDQVMRIGSARLVMMGVGQVATLPEYRGQGLMSRMLSAAIERAEGRGIALSDLSGDRLRYGRFGWEPAGRQWQFQLTARSVAAMPIDAGVSVAPIEVGDAECDAIRALHDAQPLRMERSQPVFDLLMQRWGRQVWVARRAGRIVAYAVYVAHREPTSVSELGGDPAAMQVLLATLARRLPADQHLLTWCPWRHPVAAAIGAGAANWQVVTTRALRLFDLTAVLTAFRDQLAERAARWRSAGGRGVTLVVQETGQACTLRVDGDGVVVLGDGRDGPRVELPRREMTRLLFGPWSAGSLLPPLAGVEWMELLFPLDFAHWINEGV